MILPVLALISCGVLATQQTAQTWLRAGVLLLVGGVLYAAMRWTRSLRSPEIVNT